jgi:hypothetical protein
VAFTGGHSEVMKRKQILLLGLKCRYVELFLNPKIN